MDGLDWPTSVGLQVRKVTGQLSSIAILLFVLQGQDRAIAQKEPIATVKDLPDKCPRHGNEC